MGEPKAVAALTAGLLARKGGARPAMRPQIYQVQDDLGWNDMGAAPASPPARTVPVPIAFGAPVDAPPPPVVVAQQESLAAAFADPSVRTRATPGTHGRSAFTLRLDEGRHLRLRLMGAHRHRSAQSLVTEALDRFLADFESGKV